MKTPIPSINEYFQHQIVFGKLNNSHPSPLPYKVTYWDYSKSYVKPIRNPLQQTDWSLTFQGLNTDQMVGTFKSRLYGTKVHLSKLASVFLEASATDC